MAYKKKTGGRKVGARNKVPVEIKAMIRGALEELGGQKYLVQQAKENPVAFMGLLGKIIPIDMKHAGAIGTFDIPLTEDQKKAGLAAIMRYQFKHKENPKCSTIKPNLKP